MLISSEHRNSVLYDTIKEMGLLCSEEKHIRMVREESTSDTFFTEMPLSTSDVDRVGYLYPHFTTKLEYQGNLEVWVGDTYEHPMKTTWVESGSELIGVLSRVYDIETQVANVFYHPGILLRYSNLSETDTVKTYRTIIDIRNEPYNRLDHPDRSAYYISENMIKVPSVEWLDDYTIRFTAEYTTDIDFFICSDIVGVFQATKDIGLYIDSPNAPICYHHIVVDGSPSYHIDARFYPCIKVDKDCSIRVFNDHSHRILYPEVSRLVLYPEYVDIVDPYNCGIDYLRTLKEVDDVIVQTDNDAAILRKFLRIVRFCYRIWEKFPTFCDEQSDFLICDNHTFGHEYFKSGMIYTLTDSYQAIYTTAPFEAHKDILFYDGMLFSDYTTVNIAKTSTGKLVESDSIGIPYYIITGDYDINKFTLLKFNAWEDTQYVNVGDYINEDLTINLHEKLNRFYRNLLVVRNELLTHTDNDRVRIMTTEPSTKDEHLWFELLVNATPEEFQQNTDMVINLFGADSTQIPYSVAKGAYKLDLDPKDGPTQYTDILMTYYQLNESQKKYLALQYSDDSPDPTVNIFYDVTIGKTDDIQDGLSHGLVIEDPTMDKPYRDSAIDIGTESDPNSPNATQGDLYMQQVDGDIDALLNAPDNIEPITNLSFINNDTGNRITLTEIAQYDRDSKLEMIRQYLDDDKSYLPGYDKQDLSDKLSDASDNTIDTIVYKILQTGYVYDLASSEKSNTSLMNTSLFSTTGEVIQHNVKYLISMDEPTLPNINDIWIQLDTVKIGTYIKSVISHELIEGMESSQKKPYYDGEKASMILDYGPSLDTGIELFKPVVDPTLRPIHYGTEEPTSITDMDVWYEYLDEVSDKVCYYDQETMIIRVDERLMAVQFSDNNLQGFMFDDIVLNFRGKLGIKYLSILSDLVNSGVIDQSQLVIFYKRLITSADSFDLNLARLYTGTSHIVTTTKIDTSDFSVLYSSNIGRFTMHYADENTTNREREAAYRMCIDYSNRDFAYLTNRMLVFINGKYIPRENCREEYASVLEILNFDEVISTVDILYSKKDESLMQLKKKAYAYWPLEDHSASIQRPERDYHTMETIHEHDTTMRGYYDILLDEYVFNGKLQRIMGYLEEHPDEFESFKRDIVQKFHAISDLDLSVMSEDDGMPRIIIPSGGSNPVYTIKE